MKSVLDELYDGEIRPCELQNTMEMQELIGIIANCNEKLVETLTEEQVALLEQFVDVCTELKMVEEREVFKRAFRLGVRMGIEVILVLENK